ncbi:MAG: SUF system Fe-S cluster assembly protein [Legionellales bacterium]|nr:SUF system Fe-S cluster assembly protein [Legionellales bacterium]
MGWLRRKRKNNLNKEDLKLSIIKALQTVYDPEIPVNIYDLGLIYDVIIHDDAHVDIKMTLTAPGCPVAQTFPGTVAQEVEKVIDVKSASVELVWDPPWTQDKMSEAAKLQLGFL